MREQIGAYSESTNLTSPLLSVFSEFTQILRISVPLLRPPLLEDMQKSEKKSYNINKPVEFGETKRSCHICLNI